ncbi:hypothetical protein [Allobranchiibius huperziae]|uniref:Pimeloyl-ACP methyl ester carboxylesterase n=1 Tax=Allobranchiibius huperziae TaxID=1874116 RepID=A0A853DBH1_9MICO|nr:hypothetical protein [Allobranchiibius huperziae]NYJ74288.1 pimeloyl-ACP methyl ester carboxylesterase [Allobranchiibius huperziae]
MRVIEDVVDDIPVVLLIPETLSADRELVLWLSHLGGSAEKERPTMTRLAERGHPVVSFDPPEHGRRATATDARVFAAEVLAAFRLRMWPLLGRTTLESMRVLTWAQHRLDRVGPVLAGGVSMGGDVAIALAGVDNRIRRVAAVGSTPSWERPGMRSLTDPADLLDQGEADPYSAWFAAQLDPVRHLDHYLRDVGIAFELGGEDHHIPAGNAQDFRRALVDRDPAAGDRVRITVRDGLDHFGVTTDQDALEAAAEWLMTPA